MRPRSRRGAMLLTAFLALMAVATPGFAAAEAEGGTPTSSWVRIEIDDVVPGCQAKGELNSGPSILVTGGYKTKSGFLPGTIAVAATVEVPGLGTEGVEVTTKPGLRMQVAVGAPDRFAGADAVITLVPYDDDNDNGRRDEDELPGETKVVEATFGECNQLAVDSVEQSCSTNPAVTEIAVEVKGHVVKPVPAASTFRIRPRLSLGSDGNLRELPPGTLLRPRLEYDHATGAFTYRATLHSSLAGRAITFRAEIFNDLNGNGSPDGAELPSLSSEVRKTFTPKACNTAPTSTQPGTTTTTTTTLPGTPTTEPGTPTTQPGAPVTQPGGTPGGGQLPSTGSGNATVLLLLGGLLMVSAGTTVVLAARRRQARSSQAAS
jgi:LPXTG-motif cell wall-anchored protein